MIYIDLYLEKLDSNEQTKQYKLDEILERTQANVVIILGAPGSGKSSILKNYQENHKKIADIYNVKNFIELQKTATKSILFLDGLDEYRNTSNDKVFVIEKLGAKISTLDTTKVIISCREMDWYGEDDKNALKDEINTEVEIYRILPLDYSQQLELAIKIQIDNPKVFVESLHDKGLISNPQMFVMMANLYIQNPELKIVGKSELYKEYIKYSRENNPRNKRNNLNILSEEEIFQFGGYLSCFYIFSNIDTFNETILESVATIDFSLDKLNSVLNSSLFHEQKFSHRTIAEFLAGNYLAKNLLNTSIGIDIKRIKSLFTDSDKIPTELRGTYAWLCSISKNHELIAVDPYYQAIHGDNALFDIEQKKEIVLEIKKYAHTSPYFYKFNHQIDLKGFYDIRLEEFFVQELNEAVKLKNHYFYFICSVLEGSTKLGNNILEVIKANILDNTIHDYYRDNLIQILNNEDDFLVLVLNKIKNGEFHDEEDYLKEAILRKLYPTVIGFDEVGQYLQFYHGYMIGHCFFLDRTPYIEQRKLVDEIHQFSLMNENGEKQLIINDSIKHFVDKYFLDTILKYEDDFDAKTIYGILKYFKSTYYKDYDSIDIDRFSWRLKEGQYDEKLQKLANELYGLYVQEELEHQKERYDFFSFNYFFSLKHANNCYATLLSYMNKNLDYKANESLFVSAIAYASRDEENKIVPISELQEIANKFGLNDIIKAYLNPKKLEWEIKAEKLKEEKRKKDQEQLEANEDYFAKKSDEEIRKSFNDLYWFSRLVYFEKSARKGKALKESTFERLKEILRTAIYSELIEPELLTIQQLAKLKGNNRNIDNMYYAALALNNDLNIGDQIKSDVILKYFYINSLLSSDIGNINNANFHEKVDTSFAVNTLKAYIALLISMHANKLENIVMQYMCSATDIEILQDIAIYHGYYNESFTDGFIDIFLKTFNFNISKEDLIRLKAFADESNRITIEALECFTGEECANFSMKSAIAMYDIFSHNKFKVFNPYPNPKRASVVSKMMSAFNTEESIEHVNGFQSQKNMCANFLTTQVLKVLEIEEYEELLQEHENDIWTNQIKHAFDEKKQAKMDSQGYGHYPIEYIKDFLLKQSIVSEKDFFEDVCIRLDNLAIKINNSRDNQKDKFYDSKISKDENACRDILLNDLKLLYENEWFFVREAYEANDKRVDINIKYKKHDAFEVQIECKKDKNPDLFNGIQKQLIDQYLYESSSVQYGVYFIFYFGDVKQTPEQLLKELKTKIPNYYENKIEIILLDLRK